MVALVDIVGVYFFEILKVGRQSCVGLTCINNKQLDWVGIYRICSYYIDMILLKKRKRFRV